jgi:hypothetical protein
MTSSAYNFRRIMLGHDGSSAAEQALHDSMALAERFAAELVLARVERANEDLPGRNSKDRYGMPTLNCN